MVKQLHSSAHNTKMEKIAEYSLPIALALMLAIFFLSLPPLGRCVLTEAQPRRRLDRVDALIMAAVTVLYAAVAFYKLGDAQAPQSFADMENSSAVVKVETQEPVSVIRLYCGAGVGGYTFEYSHDGQSYLPMTSFTQTAEEVLKWRYITLDYPLYGGYIRVTGIGAVWLGELVCADGLSNILPISCSVPALCDEQALSPLFSTYMNSSYFDEIYHARTAWEHLNQVNPYEITHPPLGKIIISLGISAFGMTPFGWRFSGTLFGVLMLPLMYVFLKKLFGGRAVPAAGTLVFASDFMHFVQTRIATIDTYGVFFILLMYLFMYLFISEGRLRYLALCGLFFGLGAASKWTCLYAGAGLAIIWAIWVISRSKAGQMTFVGFMKNVGFCLVFFVLIPAVIYYLSYIPYARARGGISLLSGDYLRMVLDNQKYMLNYHSTVVAEHPYSSRWYQWILDIRPILYYLQYFPDGTRSSFGAFVNPALCWGGFVSLFVLLYVAVAYRDQRAIFILIGYLAQLIPWVFISRLTFEYHYFPSTIFLILSISCVFQIYKLSSKSWKFHVFSFVTLSIALFLLFYPALSGKIVNNTLATRLLGWLPTWPF